MQNDGDRYIVIIIKIRQLNQINKDNVVPIT